MQRLRRIPPSLIWTPLLLIWAATLAALSAWSATTPAIVLALLVTVLMGALVGRWWVLWVPATPAILLSAWLLLFTSGADYEDGSPAGLVSIVLLIVGWLEAALLVGVPLGTLVRSRLAERRARGPGRPPGTGAVH